MMDKEFEYIGKADNWMDTRDLFIEYLKKCDTKLKFDKWLNAIIVSVAVSPKGINETRKSIGVPELSEEDMKEMKKLFDKDKDKKKDNKER